MPKVQHAVRAYRRAALSRKKARALRLYPHDPKARNANHLAQCSCWMCGNPRRHYGNSHTRKMNELLSIERLYDGLIEYLDSRAQRGDRLGDSAARS